MARNDTNRNVETSANTTDENRDPLSGEPGAHPVGVGLGAAGAGAAGAAIGAVAGPIGAGVGAVVGAVAGGLIGKGIAESIDPTAEDAYWRENHTTRPYYDASYGYDDTYRPAYMHGVTARQKYHDRTWMEAEDDVRTGWESTKSNAKYGWEKARHAVRDAWEHAGFGSRTHDTASGSVTSGTDSAACARSTDDTAEMDRFKV